MTQTTQIVLLIEVLAEATGLSPNTIARYVSGNGDFYARLKCGHDLTTRRAVRVIQQISNRWPANTPWPAGISRPVPSPDSPAAQAAA